MTIETTINNELLNVYSWLCANKLSLNIEKSNFIIFHAIQKRVHEIFININNKYLKQEHHLKYLGLMIDSHLNWKPHISYISNKIKRSIGIISKARHYINSEILTSLYYSLIYPYLMYGLAFGAILINMFLFLCSFYKKKQLGKLMTFSYYNDHTNPLFLKLKILRLEDLVYLHTALFMFDFHSGNLPATFQHFFQPVNQRHNYNAILAAKSTYYLPKARTNYGLLNIKYVGVNIWNSVDEILKNLSRDKFIKSIRDKFLLSYC
jgi:hypothetical protein